MRVQSLMLAVAGLFLGLVLTALSLSEAAASAVRCEKPELRAEGRRSNPGSADYKERLARRLSISKWEQTAHELYGREFGYWRRARARKIECEHYEEPGLNGRVSCVASGQPCGRR